MMVFVEYENEVHEEKARVIALLEKLRIDAQVKVFCLASGELVTYELIINGVGLDIDWEIIVNETLKEEQWWDELQMFRGRAEDITSSQEANHLSHIWDSTSGRPGVYNPHEENLEQRRASTVDVADIPKRPAIGMLSRMGVHMGIHTHHLHDEALEESMSDSGSEGEQQYSADTDEEMEYGFTSPMDDRVVNPNTANQPLLSSHRGRQGSRFSSHDASDLTATSYGTMSSSATVKGPAPNSLLENVAEYQSHQEDDSETSSHPGAFPTLGTPDNSDPSPATIRPRPLSPAREDGLRLSCDGTSTPGRPNLSRQSSAVRFSSRPVPVTKITTEAEGSTIGFALSSDSSSETTPRPVYSRQSSTTNPLGRLVPQHQYSSKGAEGDNVSLASRADQQSSSAGPSRYHSRQNSFRADIPEALERKRLVSLLEEEHEPSSAYTAHGVELSFNELPSRAQHLILNDLMRSSSKDTAVILTTLPIPSEGTSRDEQATIQYLSDVEVLCNKLPPTLMVLSNSMTVTVSI